MKSLGPTAILLLLTACGVSPELVDEPAVPETPEPAERTEDAGDRQSREWQCAGSTAATRQQGRMARHRGVEGFTTRSCIAPATEVELNPNP